MAALRSIQKTLLVPILLFCLPSAPAGAWGFGKEAPPEPSGIVQDRQAVFDSNNSPEAAAAFAEGIGSIAERLPEEPADSSFRQLDIKKLSREAVGYLDKALPQSADPVVKAQLLAEKGYVLTGIQDYAAADAVLRQALGLVAAATTLAPMINLLKLRRAQAQIPTWCKWAVAHQHPKADHLKLCQLCAANGVQACNGQADQDALADKMRLRLEARDLEARQGTSTDLSYVHDAIISLPLVNSASRAVTLFLGEDPGGGPGLLLQIPARQQVSKRLQIGSHVWLLDDQRYTVSKITVRNEFNAITVNGSGNGFLPGTAAGY